MTRNGTHNVGPAFAGLVVGMAKDRMFGGTLINCWSLTFSCFLTCFTCWIIILLINAGTQRSDDIPDYAIILIIFGLVLVMQCMELPPLGKKFGCSIVPLLIIAIRTRIHPIDVWDFQVDTIIAAGCALVGNVLPLPVEFSSVALQQRTTYCAYSATALLTDLFKAWQYQSCFNDSRDLSRYAETKPPRILEEDLSLLDKSRLKALRSVGPLKAWRAFHKHDRKSRKQQHFHQSLTRRIAHQLHVVGERVQAEEEHSPGVEVELPHQHLTSAVTRPEHRHWRKLRLTLMCAIQFKLSRGYGLGWYFSNNSCGSKFLRMELLGFLREGINDIVARNAEAKFASISPLRRYLFTKYTQFAALLRDLLSIISIMEDKISTMEETPELNYIFRAFHNVPNFRHALDVYCRALCTAIESLSDCLTHSDSHSTHPTLQFNPRAQQSVAAIATLLRVRQEFDKIYYKCRQNTYYEHVDDPTQTSYRTETAQDTKSLPLIADVLLNMNSFLFLADALCNQIQIFWSPAELSQIEACVDAHAKMMSFDSEGENSNEFTLDPPCWYWWLWPTKSMAATMRRAWAHTSSCTSLLGLAALDLFPSQKAAFAGFWPWAQPAQRLAARVRLKSAFSVALSMGIASMYGVYLHRNQAFLAAFTIAFLAGGPAAGVTMVTSLNRAAGTVVACVVAIIAQFLLVSAGVGVHLSSGSQPPVAQQLVLGIVVVLFQFPATIVRSFPLQGYAGTCASFTIAIILLAPNLDSDVAIDRIIDTFVGVIIYLTVEALLSTTYTENILLTNMKVVYEGIDERFAGFQKNFLLFKNYARTAARTKNTSLRPTELTESSKRPAVNTAKIAPAPPPLYSLNGLHLEPIDAKIKTQHDLLRFLELDPGLRRPPPVPVGLMEECVSLQVQAVKHLQVMYWAIKSCADADTDPAVRSHLAMYHSIHKKIRTAAEGGSHDDPEVSLTIVASLRVARQVTAVLRGGTNAVAPEPALPMAQAGLPAARSHDGYGTATPSSEHSGMLPPPEGFSGLFANTSAKLSGYSSENDLVSPGGSLQTPPSSANAPKFILLSLENSFAKVGQYVSLVVTFLLMSLHNMRQWKETSSAHAASFSPTRNSVRNINKLNETRVATHTDFLLRSMSTDTFKETDANLLTKLETQQVIALFSGFQTIVEQLLSEVADTVATTVVLNGRTVRTSRQNKEVKIVNAMIASTLDLLRALKGLASNMSKMQAHRDIRITQTGDRFA